MDACFEALERPFGGTWISALDGVVGRTIVACHPSLVRITIGERHE
jgi:hypothetical protein